MPGGQARQRPGDVVGHVQSGGELHGGGVAAAGVEQLGGAQDQQRRGDVAELERRHRGEQAAEPAAQHRA
jgi:hypothetical protein